MRVTLTVCGSAGTHPGPGRACSSYLVTAGEQRLLLDVGNGSLCNLMQRCDVADLDALVISHLHPDHFADIYGLYYALRFHPDGPGHMDVHAPPGARELIVKVLGDTSAPTFDTVYSFHEQKPGAVIEHGPMSVRLFAAAHPIPALATRIELGGRVIAFTGDSAPSPDLVQCAKDADLLLADATWLESARPLPEGIHMTGRQAGELAAKAGVERLVLTHILPTNDPAKTRAEAAEVFDGEILCAEDLMELEL